VLDRLAEPDLGRLGFGNHPAHVISRVLQVAERMRAKDAVLRVELGGGVAVPASQARSYASAQRFAALIGT
jgi:hypothetical protein